MTYDQERVKCKHKVRKRGGKTITKSKICNNATAISCCMYSLKILVPWPWIWLWNMRYLSEDFTVFYLICLSETDRGTADGSSAAGSAMSEPTSGTASTLDGMERTGRRRRKKDFIQRNIQVRIYMNKNTKQKQNESWQEGTSINKYDKFAVMVYNCVKSYPKGFHKLLGSCFIKHKDVFT